MTAPQVCVAEQMPSSMAQDANVPVEVVGGGACGLTAALMLHGAGIDCAVLERDAAPTGSAALSSGFIPAPGTEAQHAGGIDDSPARFAADIAVKVTGALFHIQGGLDIDAQCRVLMLNAQGQPLPNLLAAGGAARGVSGDAVWGYLSGNGLLSAVAGGYIAAHTAAHLVRSAPVEGQGIPTPSPSS